MKMQQKDPRKAVGDFYKNVAAKFLQKQNYKIGNQKVCFKFGEIDIIAKDKLILYFVEVRSRNSSKYANAEHAVGIAKQKQIIRAAQAYLVKNFSKPLKFRFDVVAFSRLIT